MKKSKILTLLLVFPLTACFSRSNFSWGSYKNSSVAMSAQSKKFKNFKFKEFNTIENDKDILLSAIRNKSSLSTFSGLYNSLSLKLRTILQSYIIATTKYYGESDATYNQKANYYYSLYVDLSTYFMSIETDIYNSSKEIKEAYFAGLSERQIEERINNNADSIIEANYDKIFNEYKDEASELYAQYRVNKDKNYYLDKGFDYFLRYINKSKEFINELSSYDSYLDYSYENDYKRDYKMADSLNFVNYVKEYFIPIVKNKPSLTLPSEVSPNLLNIIDRYNFCNSTTNMSDLFLSYAENMGDSYLNRYNAAFNGYFYFSDASNSMSTAYEWGLPGTNDAVLYFSRDYQNILSVIHEFGHYYSSTINNGARAEDAYDLQETYSQGNEFTFLKFLLANKSEDENYSTYQFYADSEAYDAVNQICQFAAITEIENFAYTTSNLTKESLINGVNEILASYDGAVSDVYFMAPCTSSPLYYISYATSLMEAVQLYTKTTFEDARESYTKLVEATGGLTMVDRWKNAGLTSPFEESTFKLLSVLFTDIAEKY